MLDVPNFFWDSEPTLHPLYQAVREYLEIRSRIQVLNERCRVFLDSGRNPIGLDCRCQDDTDYLDYHRADCPVYRRHLHGSLPCGFGILAAGKANGKCENGDCRHQGSCDTTIETLQTLVISTASYSCPMISGFTVHRQLTHSLMRLLSC